MIDARTLTDPTTCPSCNNPLSGSPTCPTCRVQLAGPLGARVWEVSLRAAALLDERARLVDQLRAAVTAPSPATRPVPPAAAPPRSMTVPPARPAPEWTRHRVQNLLLSLGVGLLAVAAVIFLVVSWSVLGTAGRAAVLLGCTALAAAGARQAFRRTLTATAEAVALLTVGLALLDAWGARSAGLAGLDRADGAVYWAGAFATVAVLAATFARSVPVRALRLSAALLALLPGPLLAGRLAGDAAAPLAVLATGLVLTAAAELGSVARWPFGPASRDARVVVAAGGGLTYVAAVLSAFGAAYAEPGSLVPGVLLLLALAGGAALASEIVASLETAGLVAATGLVVAAAWAPFVVEAAPSWAPAGMAAAVAVLLLLAALLPPHRRPAPVAALAALLLPPALSAAEPLAVVVAGQLGWLAHAWSGTGRGDAFEALDRAALEVSPERWGAEVPLLLLVVAAALAVVATVHRRVPGARLAAPAAAPVLAAAVLTGLPALDLPYAAALCSQLALAAAALLGGAELWRRRQRGSAVTVTAVGVTVSLLAVGWALAAQTPTLLALPAVALAFAAAAWRTGGSSPAAGPRLPLAVTAGVAGLAEVAALTRAGGGGWLAVATVTLAVAAVAAVAGAVLVPEPVRIGLVAAGTTALLGSTACGTGWLGGSAPDAGLALTVVAGALVALAVTVGPWLAPTLATPPLQRAVAGPAVLGSLLGVLLSRPESDRLWLALLAAGAAAAVAALRPGLHRVGWLAGLLLTASSWVRLVEAHVSAPEPYTVPAGVVLVALGFLRRRRDPGFPSWRAYATGLVLALGPSLARAVSDPGDLRPLLLAVAALAVLGAGVARRLQAPLVVGGAVLAVDALVQLSPYLLALYDAVPRWTVFAAAGLALVGVGATYEQRARDVRALRHHMSSFG